MDETRELCWGQLAQGVAGYDEIRAAGIREGGELGVLPSQSRPDDRGITGEVSARAEQVDVGVDHGGLA
jgi:hypothetical protein